MREKLEWGNHSCTKHGIYFATTIVALHNTKLERAEELEIEETKPDQNYDHFTIFQFLQCFDFHKFCKFLTSVTLKIHTLMAGGGTPSERWLLVQGGGVQIP